jgi:hypothetical protein
MAAFMFSRKLPGFREAVKPRPVGGDRSHGATFFYWILDATAERDTQNLMQFIYRNQAIILTIDPAIRLQVLSHNLSRPAELSGIHVTQAC